MTLPSFYNHLLIIIAATTKAIHLSTIINRSIFLQTFIHPSFCKHQSIFLQSSTDASFCKNQSIHLSANIHPSIFPQSSINPSFCKHSSIHPSTFLQSSIDASFCNHPSIHFPQSFIQQAMIIPHDFYSYLFFFLVSGSLLCIAIYQCVNKTTE